MRVRMKGGGGKGELKDVDADVIVPYKTSK